MFKEETIKEIILKVTECWGVDEYINYVQDSMKNYYSQYSSEELEDILENGE